MVASSIRVLDYYRRLGTVINLLIVLMAVAQNLLSSSFVCAFVHCLSECGCTYLMMFHCSAHDLEGYSLFLTVIAVSIENGDD